MLSNSSFFRILVTFSSFGVLSTAFVSNFLFDGLTKDIPSSFGVQSSGLEVKSSKSFSKIYSSRVQLSIFYNECIITILGVVLEEKWGIPNPNEGTLESPTTAVLPPIMETIFCLPGVKISKGVPSPPPVLH